MYKRDCNDDDVVNILLQKCYGKHERLSCCGLSPINPIF
jgi:hypothetical protein